MEGDPEVGTSGLTPGVSEKIMELVRSSQN
jgi:hypothetical protein